MSKPLNYDELKKIVCSLKTESQAGKTIQHNFSEQDIADGLDRGEFVTYYQPKVEASSGRMTGTEALIRWNHPDLGLISPDHFIPVAEDTELIDRLTKVVIENTIEDTKRWKNLKHHIKAAINFSLGSLSDVSLPNELASKIDAQGFDRSQFVIEVTESKLIEQDAVSMEVLARLRILGFELSIDDFGTGYSNLERLRNYPFSELKIDQSFIRQATHDEQARFIVESCAALGKDLGLRIVAEGVETPEDYKFVSQLGIDQIQGYLYAKPMPINDLLNWFLEYQAKGRIRA